MPSIMAIPMNFILLVACLQSASALKIVQLFDSGIDMEVVPESAPLHTLKAIENVNSGAGSIWLFHTTHNAGTSLVNVFNAHGFKWNNDTLKSRHCSIEEKDLAQPNTLFYNDVCGEIGMSVKIGEFDKKFSRNSDKLLTIYPIRHPIHRNLAYDGMKTWKDDPYACFTDNYGLRKLLGIGFDVHIEKHHVEAAKARAASFDIVMDMTNFTEGLNTLCSQLDWSCTNNNPAADQAHYDKVSTLHSRHREIYKNWFERNAPEMEFYKFARALSQRRLADFLKIKGAAAFSKSSLRMPSKPISVAFQKDQTQWLCPMRR